MKNLLINRLKERLKYNTKFEEIDDYLKALRMDSNLVIKVRRNGNDKGI